VVGCLCLGATHLPAQQRGSDTLSLSLRNVPLVEALLRLRREAGLPLAWRGDQLPTGHRVSVTLRARPWEEVLAGVLRGSGLRAERTASGNILLLPRAASASPDQEAAALRAVGIVELDQLVVTGSAVGPAPERDQPTAITVVREADLVASPHRRLPDQLRAFLPGVVTWDRGGAGPAPLVGGVRGVASFTARAPKVYVDGIELASPELFTLLDGRGISRLEMLHGPQGAALHGPDALNGVMQLETRRAPSGSAARPVTAAAVGGVLDRAGAGDAAWGEGAAGIGGGMPDGGFDLLLSASRLGASPSATTAHRLRAGGRIVRGAVTLEGTGWVARHAAPIERMVPASGGLLARPAVPLDERGGGITIRHAPSARLAHQVVVGMHRISGGREPFRSPILPPVLPLAATNETAQRTSVRYAIQHDLPGLQLTAGGEVSERTLTRSARQAGGGADLSALYTEALASRGAFAQVRLRVGALVLSGGGRTDRLSSVGAEADVPTALTAGATWTTPVGLATLRLRAAWGRALRPPEPGMSRALSAGTIRQEASPTLRPERQSGVELGADWHTEAGAWLRFTWFDQRAEDLLQQVDLRRPSGSTRVYQFQNVGAITNRGVEVDGGVTHGRFALAGRVHTVRSRVARLAPSYSGEFQEGDVPLEVPATTGAVAFRYAYRATRWEAGVSWVGGWTGYDWLLVTRVEEGAAQDRDGPRDYWLAYPAVVRPFVGFTTPLIGPFALWMRAEGATRREAYLRDNLSPPVGRSLAVGVEVW
jgi:iron complex outermembrane receptor protein